MRGRIGDIVGQDAGPDLDARLSRFIATARQYSTEQKAFATATAAFKDTLFASYLTRGPGAQAIRLSLYEFLDERGRLDSQYGLYTYVLFRTPDLRSQKLLQALFGSTGWAEDATKAEPSAINVFVVPVQNRIRALVAARSSSNLAAEIQAPDFYDYNYAGSLLVNLCVGLSADLPELCAEGGGGPYLLSHPDRLKRDSTVPEPYLLVDLSHVDERAFGEFVRAVKNQVMLSEFTNREKIDTLRLQLLDVALKASDWLVPVKNAVADIVIRSDSAEGQ